MLHPKTSSRRTLAGCCESTKGDQYRETPILETLAVRIQTFGGVRPEPVDEPVLSISSTRSLRRWIQDAREQLADEADDAG
jgi:hypothetical protein